MGIVTISRQLGSQGSQIAAATAEQLGFRLVGRDLIDEAARRSGAPAAALAEIDELGLLNLFPSSKACRAYHQAVREVMQELARAGKVVIVGRAGQVILWDHPAALHVRVIAPAALRAERVAAQNKIALQAAQAQIRASDEFRRKYLRRYYHADWNDPAAYHLTINTGRVTPPEAVALIRLALDQRQLIVRPDSV